MSLKETVFTIGKVLLYFFKDIYVIIASSFVSFLGYLLPIKDIVTLLIFFFIVDVIFGYWKSKVINNDKFSVKIIWGHTVPRMLVSIVIIMCSFMWDEVYKLEVVSTYKMIGWFISGVVLCSIVDNCYKITKWSILNKLSDLLTEKVKDKIGLDINDKKE